jgi:hypothetical protein
MKQKKMSLGVILLLGMGLTNGFIKKENKITRHNNEK